MQSPINSHLISGDVIHMEELLNGWLSAINNVATESGKTFNVVSQSQSEVLITSYDDDGLACGYARYVTLIILYNLKPMI
jgi:hypothetical protein